MTKLQWGDVSKRFFDTGLDRGVLYPKRRTPGEIVATNLNPNPSAEVNVSGYTGNQVTVDQGTTWSSVGLACVRSTVNAGATNDTYVSVGGDSGALRLGMQAGKTYTVVATVQTPTALTGTLNSRSRKIVAYTKVGAGAVVENSSNAGPTTGSGRVRVTFTVPVGATEAYIRLYNGSSTSGEIVRWDAISIYEGSVAVPYFDGDTADDGLYTYEWSGTAHNSTSIKRAIPALAVPWDGLTGVDENGAESAVAYYIDGRPFLFLPKPKEYAATLKAITYPDEFAAIMGLIEAADGMYLDSQMGDSFDLSYRTLVGNGVESESLGYKIHLVYNASVAPSGNSYQTLNNSINPMEFSWEIQAVPVVVDGYRPTAHIVIDTRHMDTDKLAQIEELLYGSDRQVPTMPDPQLILDILSYGDTIIINDLGNGEWEAVGSYNNIYLIGDGVFEIDNVNGTVNTDGTFTVSSTP